MSWSSAWCTAPEPRQRPSNGCFERVCAGTTTTCVRSASAAIHPYAKSLARELHEDALVLEPEQPGPVAGKVVFEQYVGVAPRVYPQYFDFGQASRKDKRGRAMSPTPVEATPRVLESSGSFGFGGPALPASRSADLERKLTEDFERLIGGRKDLELPIPSDKEDET
jgi:hypothetical protein